MITISDKESFDMIKKLADDENIFAGPSTGTVLAGLNKTKTKFNKGSIVLLFGDNATKYKSIYTKFNLYSEKEFEAVLKNSRDLCENI